MTKKLLAVDFNGALLKSRPFEIAHKEWFHLMAELLRDQAINEYAFVEDFFPHVHEVMKRYLGDVDEGSRNIFARNIYAMSIVEAVKKWDLVDEFADTLRSLKKKYAIALVTTTPMIAVTPILEKLKCTDIFDIIIASPMDKDPKKKELFEELIKKYGKPEFYIGNPDKDIKTCKELGIKAISVNWVSDGEFKGNFDIQKVEELGKVLERYEF